MAGLGTFLIFFSSAIAVFFGHFLWCFTLPESHTYRFTPQPPSPHFPPRLVNLTKEQKDQYKREGFLIIRQAMPAALMAQLETGAADIAANKTLHCSLTTYNGPPIFHKYSLLCIWPDMIHDYFRDCLIHGPLPHMASQLMGDKSVRMFNTYVMGNTGHDTLPLRWHADYLVFPTGEEQCDDGLVFWMPIKEKSEYEGNGMIMARGSHTLYKEAMDNGSWANAQSSLSGQISILNFYKKLGQNLEWVKPELDVGDVLVFSKCMVHTTSGVNSMRKARTAWQTRFIAGPQSFGSDIYRRYPEMGERLDNVGRRKDQETDDLSLGGVKYPMMFPSTIEEEDAVRRAGHITLSRMEWLTLMLSYPNHLFSSNFVRATEKIGLISLESPLLGSFVNFLENVGMFS